MPTSEQHWFRYEEYERWLGQIVEGVDSLLDHAPVQPDDVINASLLGKVWPGQSLLGSLHCLSDILVVIIARR